MPLFGVLGEEPENGSVKARAMTEPSWGAGRAFTPATSNTAIKDR